MVRFMLGVLLLSAMVQVPAVAEEGPAAALQDGYDAATAANSTANWQREVAIEALYDASERWEGAAIVRTSCLSIGATPADLLDGDGQFQAGEASARFAISEMWTAHAGWDAAQPYWLTGLALWSLGAYQPAMEQFEMSNSAHASATGHYSSTSRWFTIATGNFQSAEDAYWTVYGRLVSQ